MSNNIQVENEKADEETGMGDKIFSTMCEVFCCCCKKSEQKKSEEKKSEGKKSEGNFDVKITELKGDCEATEKIDASTLSPKDALAVYNTVICDRNMQEIVFKENEQVLAELTAKPTKMVRILIKTGKVLPVLLNARITVRRGGNAENGGEIAWEKYCKEVETKLMATCADERMAEPIHKVAEYICEKHKDTWTHWPLKGQKRDVEYIAIPGQTYRGIVEGLEKKKAR